MLYSPEYLAQLQEMHIQKEHFGKQSSQWAGPVMTLCSSMQTTDVLDYGCGKGDLDLHLPFHVKCYDPAIPKYAGSPLPADIVVCTDVLEHIEPDCLDAVLADLRRTVRKIGLFCISCVEAMKHLPDGRNAHLIVESPEWWSKKLKESGFTLLKEEEHEKDGRVICLTVVVK